MKKFGQWITNFFAIIAAVSVAGVQGAAKARGVKAVILYMYDDATVGSNVVSMEVDKRTFMNVIKDSQFAAMSAKPLKFGQDNGFFALLDGESSSFSFATAAGMADCDCKCVKKVIPTTTTPRPTTTTQRPTTTTQRSSTPKLIATTPIKTTPGPTYLPPTPTYLPPTPTYLPPTTHSACPSGGSGPFCCLNGAANRDCCANGGQGKYCCLNGENNPGCNPYRPPNTPTIKPACPNGGSGIFCCLNGANNADCCANGGKGKYCCLNGSNSPNCDAPTAPTRVPVTYPPTVRTTKFKGPLYLPQSTIKTTRVPYVTQTYTYGSPATFTYKYNWTHGPWSRDPRQSTVTYTTTTTPKYSYEGPNNRLSYAGEDDNSV